MPVPTANISGDINAAIGEVSTIRVTAVYSDPVWADETNNTVIAGGGVIPITADGLIDVNLPQTNDTVRLAIRLEYVDNATRQRESKMSDWQELTADVDFAAFMAMSPTSVPLSTAEALAARIDGYTDHGDVSGVLTIAPATGTHVLNATGSVLVTLDTAPDGRIVTLYIVGGADQITVDGMTDLELTDGAFASFVRIRSTWVLASAGASAGPVTPDTTPPSAVTDLAATPGTDGDSVTLTFTPAVDTESTAYHRFRIYPTESTAPAWPTSGTLYNVTASPKVVTGLNPSTNYTAEIQSYSAGGSQPTIDTTTFTTPAEPPVEPTWTVTDTFTATDGTTLGGRSTPTGSKPYQSLLTYETQGNNATGTITGNAVAATDNDNKGAAVTMTTANVAAEITYDLTSGGGASSVRAVLWVNTSAETDAVVLHLRGNGGLFLFRGGGVDVPLTGATTGVATTGTLRMSIQSNVVTIVSSAGTATATVSTGTGYTGTGRRLGFAAGGAGAKVDNFKAAEL